MRIKIQKARSIEEVDVLKSFRIANREFCVIESVPDDIMLGLYSITLKRSGYAVMYTNSLINSKSELLKLINDTPNFWEKCNQHKTINP